MRDRQDQGAENRREPLTSESLSIFDGNYVVEPGPEFSEQYMYDRLWNLAEREGWSQTKKALTYARKAHEGQTRYRARGVSGEVPYITHPLVMCTHAVAAGIRDDAILTGLLLHDVCEDCGIAPEQLPFTEDVRDAVRLVTKDRDHFRKAGREAALKDYYAKIRTNPVSMLIKCIDRCNNLSTMAQCFSEEKMRGYIRETEQYIIPILNELKEQKPELSGALFLLHYQIRSLLETQKALLPN